MSGLAAPSTVFFTFSIGTGIAIFAPVHWRKYYLFALFGMLLFCGLAGWNATWPFHSWHLWDAVQTRREDFYTIEVADARGQRFLYDNNAVLPKQPTQMFEMGALFFRVKDRQQKRELIDFLLTKANDRRRSCGESGGFPGRSPVGNMGQNGVRKR